MIQKKYLIFSAFVLTLAGCADMNTAVKNFNETMYSGQNMLTGVYEQDISKVVSSFPNTTTKINFLEAYDHIQKGLSIMACADKGNSELMVSRISRYVFDGHTTETSFPYFAKIKYHNDGCLVIQKINGINSRNMNELEFDATFVSKQTGESAVKHYRMRKKDTDWLFDI